jgi:hypothetical protein
MRGSGDSFWDAPKLFHRGKAVWKERLLKILRLRDRGLLFKPQLYDFIYIPEKHAVGLITQLKNQQIMFSCFPSLNNQDHFRGELHFNPAVHLIIPSYENLLQLGHAILKKESDSSSSLNPGLIMGSGEGPITTSKHRIHSRIASKIKSSGDVDDYGLLLEVLTALLIRENGSVKPD